MSAAIPAKPKSMILAKAKEVFYWAKRKSHEMRYGKQFFLIYSMGKVGSSTVYYFLKSQYPYVPVHHVHFLSNPWLREMSGNTNPILEENRRSAREFFVLHEQMPEYRLKIITMVREPLIREISDVFENWRLFYKVNSIDELDVEQLNKYLNENQHQYVLNWFDKEFKEYLAFDIYTMPFDKEKGYSIYKTEKADILCFQLEKMNDCFEQAMKEFSGMKVSVQGSANQSESKDGKELYKRIRKEYLASPEKIDRLYNSKYVRHFYAEKEINGFIERWSKKQDER